jgi:hypothetical protein
MLQNTFLCHEQKGPNKLECFFSFQPSLMLASKDGTYLSGHLSNALDGVG